jgi:Holliday junction DNA helicase RuvA
MIASIKGEVIAKEDNSLIVQNGGIGLRVFVPTPLQSSAEINRPITLFTHLAVREDNLSLYGFEKVEERDLFNELVKVSGIGPRLALSILSTLPVPMIYQAVINEKPEIFSRVPGIGGKTAQKMILYLHDRLKAEYSMEELAGFPTVAVELVDALTSLGYSVVEAQAAIQSIPKDAPEDIEERLRLALQYFTS